MTTHDEVSRLARPAFKRGQLQRYEKQAVMRLYGDHDVPVEVRFAPHDGRHGRLITRVIETIGDGKEATVYRCEADPALELGQVAVKVYRADKFRAFAKDGAYRAGERLRDRRMQRAVEKGSRRGRELAHGDWIEREWETLLRLFEAGACVPEPLACSRDSLAMELVGDARGAAPRLQQVRLRGAAARRALDAILYDVELLLACDRVHGDLSAYNILYYADRPWLIDLPQAVEASTNPNARRLLTRDVENVCKHFERAGLCTRPEAIADDLWRRFLRAEL